VEEKYQHNDLSRTAGFRPQLSETLLSYLIAAAGTTLCTTDMTGFKIGQNFLRANRVAAERAHAS
jgi:hypothetical protein